MLILPIGSLIKIWSVSLLGLPGPARFSAKTRNLYFFLVGRPFTLQANVYFRHIKIQTNKFMTHNNGILGWIDIHTYLKFVSLIGSLLHLIHLSWSGSYLSTQYPVIGFPPSSSGSYQDRVTASFAISDASNLYGGPGVSKILWACILINNSGKKLGKMCLNCWSSNK